MNVSHLSTTMISGWAGKDACPARAWRSHERRVEHGDDNEGTDATRFGTVAHAACEAYHSILMRGETPPDYADVFEEEWRKGTCYDFDYYQLGRAKVADFLRRTVEDRTGETVAVELEFVIDLVTMRIYPWPEDRHAVAAAIRAQGGVPVISKIDRIDRVTAAEMEVYDYKTNILPFTRDYIETSAQLLIYDMAVRALYPEVKQVRCVFDMVRHGRFPAIYTDEDRAGMRQYLINLFHQIGQCKKPEEKLNSFCRWCERRTDCMTYAKAISAPPEVQVVLTEETDTPEGLKALLLEYERVGNIAKLAGERQSEIKAIFQAKIVTDNAGEPLQLVDREAYLSPNPRYEYDMTGVFQILKAKNALILLRDVASISKTSMERELKKRPDLKELLDPMIKTNHAQPTLRSRTIKTDTSTKTKKKGAH